MSNRTRRSCELNVSRSFKRILKKLTLADTTDQGWATILQYGPEIFKNLTGGQDERENAIGNHNYVIAPIVSVTQE